MGRPTKLTDEALADIVDAIAHGVPIRAAGGATHPNISESTIHAWRQRGRAEQHRQAEGLDPTPEEAPYLRFLEETESAESAAHTRYVLYAEAAAAKGDGKLALAILERRWPDAWRRTDRVEVSLDESEVAGRLAEILAGVLSAAGLEPEVRARLRAELAEALRSEA